MKDIANLEKDWQEVTNLRGERFKIRDLSGEHLGVRIEELPPGGTSSEHHYHTAEEEHVIVLSGSATLISGDDQQPLVTDDHVWFRAGEEVAHHIENNSDRPFRFLVFGERNANDVVVYPKHQVMMIKSQTDTSGGYLKVNYRPIKNE